MIPYEENWLFEIGEVALDSFNKNVTVIKKALRDESWKYRKQYLVRYDGFFFKKESWELEGNLIKIV